MALNQALDKLKFDTRMVPIHLSQGNLAPADLEKYLKTIPDSAENIAPQEKEESSN